MILRRMLQSLSGVGTTKQTKKAVGYMLLGSSAFVFSIVVVGGVTRLTESGLSMIDWSLLHYRFPKSKEEWENYFELYKQSPEYKM